MNRCRADSITKHEFCRDKDIIFAINKKGQKEIHGTIEIET